MPRVLRTVRYRFEVDGHTVNVEPVSSAFQPQAPLPRVTPFVGSGALKGVRIIPYGTGPMVFWYVRRGIDFAEPPECKLAWTPVDEVWTFPSTRRVGPPWEQRVVFGIDATFALYSRVQVVT